MIAAEFAARLPDFLTDGVTPMILLRMALAVVAATLLGIERERHGRAAGLRTTLLVCLAACLAMILSEDFYRRSNSSGSPPGGWHPDPARLAAGVLAGMGFLGAGVIIHENSHIVRGVTTAATLWFVTIIGLLFGAGAIGLGILATAGSLVVLSVIPYFESWIRNDWYSDVGVSFNSEICSVEQIADALKPLKVKLKGIDINDFLEEARCDATFHLKYKREGAVEFTKRIRAALRDVPGVTRISWTS